MIYFLHGDPFLVHERQRVFQKTFAKKYPQAEFFVFDFEDQRTPTDVHRALAACETGLFVAPKMVTFLHPFALEETGEKLLVDFLKIFVEKSETDIALLFISPGNIKKAHPLARWLAQYADKEEILEKPAAKNMPLYVKRELSRIDLKASFSREALAVFVDFVGTDIARIQTELAKLTTFKPASIFEVSDVLLLVSSLPENTVFEALDALCRGDKGQSFLLFSRATSDPAGIYPLLAMCAWHVRRLLSVREAFDGGLRRAGDIATHTKLPLFAVQKILKVTPSFPHAAQEKSRSSR